MLKRTLTILLVLTLCLLLSNLAFAKKYNIEKLKIGVGFQNSWPAYGPSVVFNIDKNFAVQGTVGALGNPTIFSGRVLYRFERGKIYNVYGWAEAGLWSYDFILTTDSAFGYGVGAGIEGFLIKEIPLGFNAELGYGNTSITGYTFGGFRWGGGVHYYF